MPESNGTLQIDVLVNRLQDLCSKSHSVKTAVISRYTALGSQTDARITAFSKIINVFNSGLLGVAFMSRHLTDSVWWCTIGNDHIPDSDKRVFIREFDSFMKLGVIHGIFSAVESSLRLYLRALDPSACNGGKAEFKNVYERLYRSLLCESPAEATVLLDLFRGVRNVIHNNGVYFNPKRDNETIEYRGKSYHFTEGVALDFVTWAFILDLCDDLISLLEQTVTDPALQAYVVEILDPFSPPHPR